MMDVSGQRYGRLVALDFARVQRGGNAVWVFACDCGAIKSIRAAAVKGGRALSCGCLARELSAARCARHGHFYTAEYAAWNSMRTRCNNPNNNRYRYYGGRGISVCAEWNCPNGFESFFSHIGPRPEGRYSVDRVDNNRDYEPGNVRWATPKEQANNRRPSHRWPK